MADFWDTSELLISGWCMCIGNTHQWKQTYTLSLCSLVAESISCKHLVQFFCDFIFHSSLLWSSIVCRWLHSIQNYCNCVFLPPGLSWSEAQEPHLISGIWEFREDQFERTRAQWGMCGSLTVAVAVQTAVSVEKYIITMPLTCENT